MDYSFNKLRIDTVLEGVLLYQAVVGKSRPLGWLSGVKDFTEGIGWHRPILGETVNLFCEQKHESRQALGLLSGLHAFNRNLQAIAPHCNSENLNSKSILCLLRSIGV